MAATTIQAATVTASLAPTLADTYPIPTNTDEWVRLDDLHNGFNGYLGNRISFAPLDNPQYILEIGSGSGAWAIQAAHQFPKASVTAIDFSPLPPRPVPANLRFQKVNITESLPFEAGSFDVVHIRLVLIHVPNFEEVLTRIAQLVKPGGWLLAEDMDHDIYNGSGTCPQIKRFYDLYHSFVAQSAVDPRAGPRLEGLLSASGEFSEVWARKVPIPLSCHSHDAILNQLGNSARLSLSRAYRNMDQKIKEHGLTNEIQKRYEDELNDLSLNLYTDFYFTWSRRMA